MSSLSMLNLIKVKFKYNAQRKRELCSEMGEDKKSLDLCYSSGKNNTIKYCQSPKTMFPSRKSPHPKF